MTRAQGNRGWAAVMVAAVLMTLSTAIAAPAQTFTTLVDLGPPNGANPQTEALAQGLNSDLYGTTAFGGAYGWGTIFKLTKSGKLSTLYNFCAQSNCPMVARRTRGSL